jgi:hypothetical protein
MDITCPQCHYNLLEFEGKLRLSGQFHSVYCPVCGARVWERAEFPGVFYDEEQRSYIVWSLDLQRPLVPISVAHKLGSLDLTIEGQALNPNDLCYESVVIFQNGDDVIIPSTGIKPEYYHYLRPHTETPRKWEPPYFTFWPQLRGAYSVPLRRRALVSQTRATLKPGKFENGTALNIWPNFRRDGWRNYFVYFASSDPNVIVKELRVIGEAGEEKRFVGSPARGEVDFVPTVVEIRVADTTGQQYWSSCQIAFDASENIPPPAGADNDELEPVMAVDFGTSNTCFAIKFAATAESEVVSFRDRTKRLITGFSVEDYINMPWFPEIQESHQDPNQLPSELIFDKDPKAIGPELKDFQPIVNYTIPPFTRYREGEEKYIQGEFKWEDAKSLPNSLRPFAYHLQYLYLALAFRLALAEIVSNPRCQRLDRIDLVATCPLAFSTVQRDKFRNSIGRVQREVLQRTGINLVLQKIYDESHAGEAGSGQMPGTFETAYVDVGGGTTDIGFFRFENEGNQSLEKSVFLDSMQYAGDDVWNAIAESRLSDWGPTRFEREARACSAANLFDEVNLEAFRQQRNNLQKARQGLQRFIDGLIEYIVRMIAARESCRTENEQLEGGLGLYLLGNGWRFVEGLSNPANVTDISQLISTSVAEQVSLRLKQYGFKAPPLTVIYPCVSGVNPKTVVAVGAITLYIGEKAGRVLPEPEFTLKSFVGSDVAVFSPNKTIVSWSEEIPRALPGGNVRTINYQRRMPFDFELENIGGQKIEAVNLIDKNILSSKAGLPALQKNVFAWYLENWHKASLLSTAN